MRERHPTAARARGAALAMALIFLVILTLIGVGAMNTTLLQEKMAGNLQDRTVAFQAAESALLFGENWINGLLSKPEFPDPSQGLYLPTSCSVTTTPIWECVDWSSSNVRLYTGSLTKVATPPRYIVEDMGEVPDPGGSKAITVNYKGTGKTMLRVTARGTGRTDAAQAMVQSTFVRPF